MKASPLVPKGSRWEEEKDGEALSGTIRGVLTDLGFWAIIWLGTPDTPLG